MPSILTATPDLIAEDLDDWIFGSNAVESVIDDLRATRISGFADTVHEVRISGRIETVLRFEYTNRDNETATAVRVLLTDGTLITNGVGGLG